MQRRRSCRNLLHRAHHDATTLGPPFRHRCSRCLCELSRDNQNGSSGRPHKGRAADGAREQGHSIDQIHERAAQLGLLLCPLELGPHLRLQFLEQPEGSVGYPPSQHRAPPGSITVASPELVQDECTPKGFYLRHIEGILWLRGYRSGPEHLWSPEDRLVFCCPEVAG